MDDPEIQSEPAAAPSEDTPATDNQPAEAAEQETEPAAAPSEDTEMPSAIDQERLDSPNMKVLDINNPPLKQIAVAEYPKMLYLHPVDKTREHLTKVVENKKEEDAAKKQGWKNSAHVPAAPETNIDESEYEID